MLSARPCRPHEHVHVPRGLRQEHRRLPGRVAAADDDHLFAAAQLRFDERRAVVDAGAFERARLSTASRRYSAPVAMITVARRTRRPSSISSGVRLARRRSSRGRAFGDQDLRAELLRLRVARGRRAPVRRCRSESRGSSRSASSSPPVRRARSTSSTSTSRPSDAPYTAAASPAGPAPTIDEVAHVRLVDRLVEPEAVGDLADWSGCAARRRRGRSAPARRRRRRGSDRAAPGRPASRSRSM